MKRFSYLRLLQIVLIVAALILVFASCGKNPAGNSSDGCDLDHTDNKISLEAIVSSEADSAKIIVKNNGNLKISFGEDYYIQKKTNNGWKDVKEHIDHNVNLVLFQAPAGDNYSFGETLFDRAFFIAVEELRERAARLGADAVIGMRCDFVPNLDTNAFQYFYLQMYGTAVKYKKKSDGKKIVFDVESTNTREELLINHVSISELGSVPYLSAQAYTSNKIKALQADIVFTDIFNDDFLIENVIFANWDKRAQRLMESEITRIDLEENLMSRIKTVKVIVKKYVLDENLEDKLIIVENRDMFTIKDALEKHYAEKLEEAIVTEDKVDFLKGASNISQILELLSAREEFQDGPGYYITKQVRNIKRRYVDNDPDGVLECRETVNNYYKIKAGLLNGTVIPSVEDGKIICPLCGYKQAPGRTKCFNCSIDFDRDNMVHNL